MAGCIGAAIDGSGEWESGRYKYMSGRDHGSEQSEQGIRVFAGHIWDWGDNGSGSRRIARHGGEEISLFVGEPIRGRDIAVRFGAYRYVFGGEFGGSEGVTAIEA